MLLILLQAAGVAADSIPWQALLQFGPAGGLAGGLIVGAKVLVRKLDEMERRTEAAMSTRDAAFLAALRERDSVMREWNNTIAEVVREQRQTALLIGTLTRLLESPTTKRLPPGAVRDVVRAVNDELGGK